MDELRMLIRHYDPYYEMADDGLAWQRGHQIHNRIRELVGRLRANGHGTEVEVLLHEHPDLVACPGGSHALA